MTQNQREWLINGVLLVGIVLLLVLIARQRLSGSGPGREVLSRSAESVATTVTLAAPSPLPSPALPVGSETMYNPNEIPRPASLASAPPEYPNLGKADIFRPLITPLPATPTPTPTAAATPSLEKATENWKLFYRRRGIGKPTSWVFKNTKRENQKTEIQEGKTLIVNDGAQDFEITVKGSVDRPLSVTLQYKDQEKTFSQK